MKYIFAFALLLSLVACGQDSNSNGNNQAHSSGLATDASTSDPAVSHLSPKEENAAANKGPVFLGETKFKTESSVVEENVGLDKVNAYAEELREAIETALADHGAVEGRLTMACSLRRDGAPRIYLNYLGMDKSSLEKIHPAINAVSQPTTKASLVEFEIIVNVLKK